MSTSAKQEQCSPLSWAATVSCVFCCLYVVLQGRGLDRAGRGEEGIEEEDGVMEEGEEAGQMEGSMHGGPGWHAAQ